MAEHPYTAMELVTYDPENGDTYPSVCPSPMDVEEPFGFVGGETLLFDGHGGYVGQVVKQLKADVTPAA